MICYHCTKASYCSAFKSLDLMSEDFCINDCRGFDDTSIYKYRKIAEYDILMKLIYDYFTGNIKGHSEDEVRKVITSALLDM